MATVKELKEKYKERINPSKDDINKKGITPLSKVELAAIDQGIDPENVSPTAGDTLRDGIPQAEELERRSKGNKESKEVDAEQEDNAETPRAVRKTRPKAEDLNAESPKAERKSRRKTK